VCVCVCVCVCLCVCVCVRACVAISRVGQKCKPPGKRPLGIPKLKRESHVKVCDSGNG